MKTGCFAAFMPLIAFPLACSGQDSMSDRGRNAYLEALPKRVVSMSANVQPGEVVVIAGGTHTIPLMEELAIEVLKAGGMPEIILNSERVTRFLLLDAPEKCLEQEPRYWGEWTKHTDVTITLPTSKDMKALYGNVPEDRRAKYFKLEETALKLTERGPTRWVIIHYPSAEAAGLHDLDFAVYERMYWGAVNADYGAISEKGRRLRTLLQGAGKVRVTSPAGTDFTFSIRGRPIFVDDGIITREKASGKRFVERQVTLPGGSVRIAPIEASANGRVVVPRAGRTAWYPTEPLTGMNFELREGRLKNFKAEQDGEAFFRRMLAASGGAVEVMGSFSIGLNPALRVTDEGGDYRPAYAAGMVWISLGDNQALGGANNGQGRRIPFPIVRASVELDGKTIVKDGQLVF